MALIFKMAASSLLRLSGRATLHKLSSPVWSASLPISQSGCTALTANSLITTQQVRLASKSRFSDPEIWNKGHAMKASKHWAVERYLATALIPIIPLTLMYPNPYLEYLMTAGVFLHAHWGIDGVTVDYIHRKVLPPKVCEAIVLLMGGVAFGCMCYFNYTDVGVVQAIKLLWTL